MINQLRFALTRKTVEKLVGLQATFRLKEMGQLVAFMSDLLTKIITVYRSGGRIIMEDASGKQEELRIHDQTIREFIY